MRHSSLGVGRLLQSVALALIASLWAATAGAQPFQFGPRAPLNTNAATDTNIDYFARVATDGAGTWIAVWTSQPLIPFTGGHGEGDILVARSTDDGITWSAPASIYPNPALDVGFDGVAGLASDGAGHWVVVWTSFTIVAGMLTDQDILLARSSDGGATWTAPVPLNSDAATDQHDDSWPQVVTDRAGTWVAVWYRQAGDYDIYTARSTDLGATWSAPVPLNSDAVGDPRSDHYPQLATDGSTWVTVWEEHIFNGGPSGSDSDIAVARSTDGGVTWSAPALLNTNASVDVDYDLMPQIATDGAVWVAVWTLLPLEVDPDVPTESDIVVARSTDGGVTWSAPAPLNTNAAVDSDSDETPFVATDGTGTWIAAWSRYESPGGTLAPNYRNILQARSSDGGTTWTAPAPINTDAYFDDCNYREYYEPQLATDGGTWLAVWWGVARGCPGLSGSDEDIFMARASTACGNGVLDAGEQCDDGGLVAGDGCDPSCHVDPPPSVCGNGIHEIGEECDDGNANVDDGCDPSCHFDPPPSVCGNGVRELGEQCDDGNLDPFDGCDPNCRSEMPWLTCGNGVIDPGEQCDDGGLAPNDGCDAGCRFEPCRAVPDATCRGAVSQKASLKIRSHASDARKNSVAWKWRGVDATSVDDFLEPYILADYNLCVYAAGQLVSSTHIPAGGTCAGKPCWSITPMKGYVFKDKTLTHDGAARLILRAGAAGTPQLSFAGRGVNLETPSLPAAGPVEVQLRRSNGALCWGATFSAPFQKSDGAVFVGRSD